MPIISIVGNVFNHVAVGAFKNIRVGADVKFKDNEVLGFDYGALQFYKGRVNFNGSLFTGLWCPCEGGTINGAVRERDGHILKLLGSENIETFGVSLTYLCITISN